MLSLQLLQIQWFNPLHKRVKFESTSEDPPASKTLTVKTTNLNNAGAEQTGTASATINFTKLNDAPSITSGNTASFDENLPISDSGLRRKCY